MSSIDLHCHSKLSDGSTSIDELLFISCKTKIETLSVTDHDTFAGALRAQVISKRYGIKVILGAEFTSFSKKLGREIHILCYMCEHPDRLEGLCQFNSSVRQRNMIRSLQKIMKYYPVSPQTVSTKARGSSNIFKNHILQAVMDAGYSVFDYNSRFGKLFDTTNYSDTSDSSKSCFTEPERVITAIHQAEGLAVLAHPLENDHKNLLPEFFEYNLDGIEVSCPNISEIEQQKLVEFAEKHNLIMTGGSNFHGMYSDAPRILGSYKTNEKQLELMFKRKSRLFV